MSVLSEERPTDDQGAVGEVKPTGEDHMRRELSHESAASEERPADDQGAVSEVKPSVEGPGLSRVYFGWGAAAPKPPPP